MIALLLAGLNGTVRLSECRDGSELRRSGVERSISGHEKGVTSVLHSARMGKRLSSVRFATMYRKRLWNARRRGEFKRDAHRRIVRWASMG